MGIRQIMLTNPWSYQRRKGPMAEINVVPYIDVMLVLLVIFMVTTPLLSQGVKVNLPKAHAQPIAAVQEPIIVSMDAAGHYYLNTASQPAMPQGIQQLTKELTRQLQLAQQKQMSRQVFVKADSKVDYGKVVSLMVLLQQAGAVNIGLLTEPAVKSI